MPPLPRLNVPALAEHARQLRYTPAKAARRQLEAAEALAGQLDAAGTYPEDWVIFRITGYRPDLKRPALIGGEDLLRDLSPLVEHLCVAAALKEADLGGNGGGNGWIGAEELCERWRISRRTLDRYRRQGLIARRVAVSDGPARHRLLFAGEVAEAFAAARPGQLARAAGFSRIDADVEEMLLRRAARYRQRLGWPLGRVARRLAERTGRSPEAIRRLLIRADQSSRRPIFGRGTDRRVMREVIERAYDRGCGAEAPELAERLGVSVASVYRILAQRRAQRLRELAAGMAGSPVLAAAELAGPDAEERLLTVPAARQGLGRPGPATLAELLAFVAGAEPQGPKVELARAMAYWRLVHGALRRASALSRAGGDGKGGSPRVVELDEIETRLRWAARVKAEMVRLELPLVVRTIEAYLGRPLTALPAGAAGRVVALGIDAAIEGVERYDPLKGGRLAAPVSLSLSRAVSQWVKGEGAAWVGPRTAGLARPRSEAGDVPLADFTRRVCAWQAWLEPDARVQRGLGALPAELATLLVQRYGWAVEAAEGDERVGWRNGGIPQTLAAVGARLGVIPARVSRLEHRAMRAAMGLPATGGRVQGIGAGVGG